MDNQRIPRADLDRIQQAVSDSLECVHPLRETFTNNHGATVTMRFVKPVDDRACSVSWLVKSPTGSTLAIGSVCCYTYAHFIERLTEVWNIKERQTKATRPEWCPARIVVFNGYDSLAVSGSVLRFVEMRGGFAVYSVSYPGERGGYEYAGQISFTKDLLAERVLCGNYALPWFCVFDKNLFRPDEIKTAPAPTRHELGSL